MEGPEVGPVASGCKTPGTWSANGRGPEGQQGISTRAHAVSRLGWSRERCFDPASSGWAGVGDLRGQRSRNERTAGQRSRSIVRGAVTRAGKSGRVHLLAERRGSCTRGCTADKTEHCMTAPKLVLLCEERPGWALPAGHHQGEGASGELEGHALRSWSWGVCWISLPAPVPEGGGYSAPRGQAGQPTQDPLVPSPVAPSKPQAGPSHRGPTCAAAGTRPALGNRRSDRNPPDRVRNVVEDRSIRPTGDAIAHIIEAFCPLARG